METRLCKVVRGIRELREAAILLEASGKNLYGVPEGFLEVLEEILRIVGIPEKQRELFWILTCPEKD